MRGLSSNLPLRAPPPSPIQFLPALESQMRQDIPEKNRAVGTPSLRRLGSQLPALLPALQDPGAGSLEAECHTYKAGENCPASQAWGKDQVK